MKTRLIYLAAIIVFIAGIFYQSRYLQVFNHDLRNRVVGSRLIHENRSPYYFQWTSADGERFYDPLDNERTELTRCTATPFFLRLIQPLILMNEPGIQLSWFVISYLLLAASCFLFCISAEEHQRRPAIILIFALSGFSFPWSVHLFSGQYYIFVVFLLSLIYFLLQHNDQSRQFVAGFVIAILVLIRPTAILFFIPFLFRFRAYKKFLLSAGALLAIYLAWAYLSGEIHYWKEFVSMSKEWNLIFYNDSDEIVSRNSSWPAKVEGQPLVIASDICGIQVSNLPKIIKLLFHYRLSMPATQLILVFFSAALLFFFRRSFHQHITSLLLSGFFIYFFSEFVLYIYRSNYNAVQWIFAVAIVFVTTAPRKASRWLYIFLLTGWILNLLPMSFIKMNTTIGEILIVAALFIFMYQQEKAAQINKAAE